MEKILELNGISLKYQTLNQETLAVNNLSFECEKGEFVSIIGPSGCGKTTVLSMIAGLLKPSNGKIIYNCDKEKVNLGYMLQRDELFPWRTIEENIFLPLEIKKICDKAHKEYSLSLLKKYGLYEFRKNYPHQLSGGMKQRVALIRTLSFNPELLLLDEPFSALDSQTKISVCDDVYRIIKAEKKTAILVTHDISEAISMSDKIIILSERPCRVKMIIRPDINADSPLERRETKEFSDCFTKIWKQLN